MPAEDSKPRWPTILAASAFAGLLLIGSVVGYYAGEEKPTVAKAKSTFLAKLERDRVKPVPATVKAEEPEVKPKPTKAAPPPPPTTKPAPEPKKPEPVKPEPTKPAPAPEPKKPEPTAPVIVSFDKVLPIFKAKCNLCHGDPSIKGDLDLRSLAAIAKGPNKTMVVPGNPEKSELWLQIKGDDPQMPPPGKDKLTAAEKQLIQDWIKSGGK